MVASLDGLFEHGALAQLALVVGEDFYAAARKLRGHLIQHAKIVAREEVVLKIRHARLLAWMKHTDLSLVDYSGWETFLVEHSLWKGSRTRELIRLVESGLDHILNLVCHKVIPLSIALRAVKELPRNASAYDQLGWLAEAVEQHVPPRDRSRMTEIKGDLMRIVETARAVAKVLIGWTAPVHLIDRFIIQCFEEGLTEAEILERAKAVPGRPKRLDEPPPTWEHEPKPLVIGGWVEPKDQADCMAQLKFVRARLEERKMILGMAYVHIRDHELWRDNFYGRPTLEIFCREDLEIDQRTLERYAAAGRELFFHPEACTAIATGRVTGDRAQFAIAHGWGLESLEPMIDLASRLDCAEMARAEELEEPVALAYGPAVGMAHEVESILGGEPTENGGELARQLASVIAGEPTGIGGQEAALIAQHVRTECPTRNGAIRVGLRDATYWGWSRTPSFSMFVPPELIEAAKWFADNVKLPKETGTRKMAVHDCYCCQNPRCRKITIRVHSHHIWFQEDLGPDDDWNLIALCPACHLRGIHSSRMRLVRIGDWLVWTYGDGGVAIVHSPVGAHASAA